MKVDKVHTVVRTLDRADQEWRTSSHANAQVEVVYLGLEGEGVIGIGATAAHPLTAPAKELLGEIEGVVVPTVEGASLDQARWQCRTWRGELNPRVVLALDLALQDLLAKQAGVPCEVLWGGSCRDRVKVIRMVGMKEPEALPSHIEPLVAAGTKALKVKIGDGIERDVARVDTIRRAFGDDIDIMVDANGAYTADEAIDLARRLEGFDISLIEQPVPYDDHEALAAVTKASQIDIVADQAVKDARDTLRLCQIGGADAIGIKITKMGSIEECLKVIGICEAFDMPVHLGGTAAPALVDSAATRLALSQPAIVPECEVSESLALVGDIEGGIRYVDGYAVTDGRLGLGGPSWEDIRSHGSSG